MKNFIKYKLQLVKEESSRYEVEKKISSPKMAYDILINVCKIQEECEEVLLLLTLDTKNNVTGYFEVSRGSLNASLIHPREIFKRALLNNAASIMVCHNHPSGNPEPSGEDINITKRLKECGTLIGIALLDHIIVGDNKYVSLKEKGVI